MTTINKTIAATAQDLRERLAAVGIPLDGSEASLQGLDGAIDVLWGDSKPADEYFDGMVWGYGCYVADVLQRHRVGEWKRSDEIGYDFVGSDGAPGVNPWQWVEQRFLFGEPVAPAYAAATGIAGREGTVAEASSGTNVSIQGAGLSLAFMTIDQERFRLLTELGVTEADYQALLDDVEREGSREEGLRVDGLTVAVGGEIFTCSRDRIAPQLADRCLLPRKPYARLKAGEYLLVEEQEFEARWEEIGVENFSPSRLRFNVACVQPSQGVEHLLMDFTFSSDATEYVATYSAGSIAYVVDRQGRRHTIKVAYEW